MPPFFGIGFTIDPLSARVLSVRLVKGLDRCFKSGLIGQDSRLPEVFFA